jgi:hypothetical protein
LTMRYVVRSASSLLRPWMLPVPTVGSICEYYLSSDYKVSDGTLVVVLHLLQFRSNFHSEENIYAKHISTLF